MRAARFRLVWATVLLFGTAFAVAGSRPLAAILFAQAANGLLLPFCAVFLLLVMNRRELLGEYTNKPLVNVAGAAVLAVTLVLGLTKLVQVYQALAAD